MFINNNNSNNTNKEEEKKEKMTISVEYERRVKRKPLGIHYFSYSCDLNTLGPVTR